MTNQNSKLNETLNQLQKTYGKGSVMRMGDQSNEEVPAIPTGSLGLDMVLGCGGFPRGRIVELYGQESSGKTTLAMQTIAEEQKQGGNAAFIDAEHAFDKYYAENLGIDTENLLISQPSNGEEALEITNSLIDTGEVNIIVIDSVAALIPKDELTGDMGDTKMGLHARLMSQALRKLTGTVNNNKCTCIFINQMREKIGVMYGSPYTTTGGNALKFYSSVRLEIKRTQSIKDSKDVIGNRTQVKVAKNKVAPPFRIAEFDIIYGEGISRKGEILDLAVDYGIVDKKASWFHYNGMQLGQGREQVKQLLNDNPELSDEIEAAIKNA